MTAGELIEELQKLDLSMLMVFKAKGRIDGVLPVADGEVAGKIRVTMDGETYTCAVLVTSPWP